MTTTSLRPQAGDLILVQEPRWDPVAHAIRVTTGSAYSHAIVALGHGEFAECHTGDQVISAFRTNRFDHRIMTKYRRVTLFRPTQMVGADDGRREEMRERLLYQIHRLQGHAAWAARHADEDHEDSIGRRVAFALADGIGRGIIQRKVARTASADATALTRRIVRGRTNASLRLSRAIVVSTSTRGRERVFCSEFAYTVLTWAAGDFIDVSFLLSRLRALFGHDDAPSRVVPLRPHQPGAVPRYDVREQDTWLGQTREKLRSVAGVVQYTAWIVKYVVRPVTPDLATLTVADFVTPADLECSGSFVVVAERRRGEAAWRAVDHVTDEGPDPGERTTLLGAPSPASPICAVAT